MIKYSIHCSANLLSGTSDHIGVNLQSITANETLIGQNPDCNFSLVSLFRKHLTERSSSEKVWNRPIDHLDGSWTASLWSSQKSFGPDAGDSHRIQEAADAVGPPWWQNVKKKKISPWLAHGFIKAASAEVSEESRQSNDSNGGSVTQQGRRSTCLVYVCDTLVVESKNLLLLSGTFVCFFLSLLQWFIFFFFIYCHSFLTASSQRVTLVHSAALPNKLLQ